VITTYGGGGDGDGGNDVGGVDKDVGDDAFGKEEEEEEDEDEDEVSQDASEIIEGLIRNGIGRRESTKSCFGDVVDMIQGTEESMRLGSRELTRECCGDQGGGGEFDC
jgi:hypothetical protein